MQIHFSPVAILGGLTSRLQRTANQRNAFDSTEPSLNGANVGVHQKCKHVVVANVFAAFSGLKLRRESEREAVMRRVGLATPRDKRDAVKGAERVLKRV